MVPMARAPSDRGSQTQPERTNQSYWRRLSDQDNNHVIERGERERERKVPQLLQLNLTSLQVSPLKHQNMWPVQQLEREFITPDMQHGKSDVCTAFHVCV